MAEDYKAKLLEKVQKEMAKYEENFAALDPFEQMKKNTIMEKRRRIVNMLELDVRALKNSEAKKLWKTRHTLDKLVDSYNNQFVSDFIRSVEEGTDEEPNS